MGTPRGCRSVLNGVSARTPVAAARLSACDSACVSHHPPDGFLSRNGNGRDSFIAHLMLHEVAHAPDESDKRSFVSHPDASSAYRFEFAIPCEGSSASIRLLPVGANTSVSKDYEAVVILRGPDMIVLLMINDGIRRGDKFESYTLYPKLGVGFLTTTSSYLGIPKMKELAPIKPEIPAGSGMVFPLRRIDR